MVICSTVILACQRVVVVCLQPRIFEKKKRVHTSLIFPPAHISSSRPLGRHISLKCQESCPPVPECMDNHDVYLWILKRLQTQWPIMLYDIGYKNLDVPISNSGNFKVLASTSRRVTFYMDTHGFKRLPPNDASPEGVSIGSFSRHPRDAH